MIRKQFDYTLWLKYLQYLFMMQQKRRHQKRKRVDDDHRQHKKLKCY